MASGIEGAAVAPTAQPPGAGIHDENVASAHDRAEDRISPRTVWLMLTLSTIVAAALRFPFLNAQSLWFDEVFTREVVRQATLSGIWHHLQQTESTPPLYYVVGWLVRARSAAAMRAIPALALTAAVPVAYLAFRRLVGQRAALATAAVLAVSPMLVAYSTDARSYGLLVFVALLTVWGFSAVLERASGPHYALWALACVACVWTHYFGAFVVAAEVAILLALRARERLKTLGWLLVIGAGVAPLVPLAAAQAGSERTAFIEAQSISSRTLASVRQFAMGANVPRTWLEGAGIALWCLAVAVGALMAIRGGRGARIVLVLAAFSVGLPLLLGITGIEDRFYARNLIVAVPIAIAVAAPAMLRMRALPLAAYLVLAALASVWVATDWRYEQPDWRHAIARTQAVDPRAPLIAVGRSAAPVVRTYLGRAESSPAGLETQRAWVLVEPTRGAHDRALVPAPAPVIPGFTAEREFRAHAFRMILVAAPRPTHLASNGIPEATLFPGRH